MDKRQIKRAAPALLSAAKNAYKLLLEPDHPDPARQAVLKELSDAIDIAENDEAHKVEIVVTRAAADSILSQFKSVDAIAATDLDRLVKQLEDGRFTKRRVYWKLDVDIPMLKYFKLVLGLCKPKGRVGDTYARVIEELDEVVSKSALEYLADAGL